MGWFPTRIFHAARRKGSSTTIGTMLLLGGAGLFLWHVFYLWALEMAIGNDLPAATYHILAGIMIVNIVCYELLRTLVSNRRKVVKLVCCGVAYVLWPARAACKIATRVVLRTATRLVGNAVKLLKTMAPVTRKTARRVFFAVLRAAGIFLKTVLSFVWKGVTSTAYAVFRTPRRVIVNAAYFIKTKIFRRWRGTGQFTADEHDMRRPWTIDEPPDATEAADVLQPKRRRDDGVVSEDVRRHQSQKRTPRSHGVPACTSPPRAKPHPRHGTKREGEDTAHFKMNQHPAQTPARLSTTAESGLAYTNPPQAKSSKRYQKQRESEDTVHDGSKKRDREATPKRPSMRAEKCEEPASERIRVDKPPVVTEADVTPSI